MNKRTYGKVCCVVNCKNTQYNTKNVHFYSFSMKPHKVEQREKWIKAVRRRNADGSLWQPNKYTKICSEHFIGNAKSEHPLSPSFLPTIFPPCYLKSPPSEKFISSAKRRFVKSVVAGSNEAIKPKIIKMSESESAKSFLDFNESVLESTLRNQETEEILPKYVDMSVQEHILPERIDKDSNLLVCNRFEKDGVCEVQTQANLQPICVIVSDKCCGSDVTVEEKCIGPDSNDLNDKLMIKC